MLKLTYILTSLFISLATIAPEGMVLCKKDGKVSIELEQGDACSCQSLIADLIEKFCCDEVQCHEEELLTENCHEENQINSDNCQDTKLDLPNFLKAQDFSSKVPTKVFLSSHYFNYPQHSPYIFKGFSKPIDVGKWLEISSHINTPLSLNKSTVLII